MGIVLIINIILEVIKMNKNKNFDTKAYQTSAVTEIKKELPESKVPVPSKQAVIDAKEFVDENEK